MPFARTRPPLILSNEERSQLLQLAKSRSAPHSQVARARILLGYSENQPLAALARASGVSLGAVNRCIDKALSLGIKAALSDLPRSGRPASIPPEAKLWVVELACQKPTSLGMAHELWTISLLASYVITNAESAGYPELSQAGKSLIHDILSSHELRPHRIRYYLESRDPEFTEKKARILIAYQEVPLQREHLEQEPDTAQTITISLDEKPGCQVLKPTAPDLAPVPGQYPGWARDYEYERLGTVSLLAGLDLVTGHIHGLVRERHRSVEFIELLTQIDQYYPKEWTIRILCDNHSAHRSKETQAYLHKHQGRFEFVFTPTHASWLNIVEVLFSKMTRSVLRGIRADSVDEFKTRIEMYWASCNEAPAPFHWSYNQNDLEILTKPAPIDEKA